MRRILVLIFVILFGSFATFSQRIAPGYMGKRFVLKYDLGIAWDFSGHVSAVPNVFHNLQGDFALSKKLSFGTEYTFMYRKYTDANIQLYDNGTYTYTKVDFNLDRSFLHKAGLYIKIFSQRNGHIAPAGPYLMTGFHLHIIEAHEVINSTLYNLYTDENEGSAMYRTKHFYYDVAPFIGGGKQYILGNKFIIDFGVRVSIPIAGLFVGAIGGRPNNYTDSGQPVTSKERYITRYQAMLYNSTANLIELRIGFGGLVK